MKLVATSISNTAYKTLMPRTLAFVVALAVTACAFSDCRSRPVQLEREPQPRAS